MVDVRYLAPSLVAMLCSQRYSLLTCLTKVRQSCIHPQFGVLVNDETPQLPVRAGGLASSMKLTTIHFLLRIQVKAHAKYDTVRTLSAGV